jgi:hypothetical protein
MKWKSLFIWIPVLLVCLGLLYIPTMTHKEAQVGLRYKSAPLAIPNLAVVPQPTNWMDVGLKIGSLLGGIMTLLNIIEKVIKMVRRKDVVRDSG